MDKRLIVAFVVLALAVAGAYVFSQSPESEPQTETVRLYYYNPALDQDAEGNIKCSRDGLVAVGREISREAPIEYALKLLLRGELTEDERAQGITTEFPLPGFSLLETEMEGETLTLVFEDPENRSSGGACRAGVLWFQIEATAKQFPGVEEVRFLPEELFQP